MPSELDPFSAVVFDMDGVLLDTEPLYKQAMHQACAELGFEMTEELHNAQIGIPAEVGEQMMMAAFGAGFPMALYLDHTRRTMRALTAEKVPVKPGALELLTELRARRIPAAVATSTSRPTAPDRLTRAGLIELFSAIVTRSDVTFGKPHPEPFLMAASLLKVAPSDCLALEDSYNGIRSAHGAGMQAVMVPDLLPPEGEVVGLCRAVMPSLVHVRVAAFGA